MRNYLIFALTPLIMSFALAPRVQSGQIDAYTGPQSGYSIEQQVQTDTDDESFALMAQDRLAGLSDDERDWYRRFQKGGVFFDGWSNISRQILQSFPDTKTSEPKKILDRLGLKIGTEWCRDNNIRRIDNKMLKAWGEQMDMAFQEGPEEIRELILSIEMEVDGILQNAPAVSLN